jgi:hypothetical protein
VNLWEFVHSPSRVRERWRWRKNDDACDTVLESPQFTLFLDCLADSRKHGFGLLVDAFRTCRRTPPAD